MKRIAILLPLALAGCAVPYSEMNPIGGVEHTALDEKTYTVHARGNGFTSKDDVRDYIILRSADIAAAQNCGAFEVVTARDIAIRYYRKSDGRLAHEFPEMEATVRLICAGDTPSTGRVFQTKTVEDTLGRKLK